MTKQQTLRVALAPTHLDEARRAAAARNPVTFADVVERGLLLRVRGNAATGP